MNMRELICLQVAKVWIMPGDMQAIGWKPCLVDTVSEALALFERRHPQVGLVLLDGAGQDEMADQELEALLVRSCGEMEWVGLVSADRLERPFIRHLLATYLYDYHTLPVDGSRLLTILGHVYGMVTLRAAMPPQCGMAPSCHGCMIGESPAMRRVFHLLDKLAAVDSVVMLRGESGTGKELAARIIYQGSMRRDKPFVAINCGAIPANLIQSELFGHEKGAFTGAHCRHIGHIEAVNGGTLFLDEIGDLPLELQVNLLRFLQEKSITRVGGSESIPVDIRVITATHRHLREEIRAGRFREDLFFRLCVLDLELPPLRERRGDIALLAHFFLHSLGAVNPLVHGFSASALQQMQAYPWPGNVRELKNRVERALVMCERRIIQPQDLELELPSGEVRGSTLAEARSTTDRLAVQQALQSSGQNVMIAARQLGISRVTLYRMIEKYKLPVSDGLVR